MTVRVSITPKHQRNGAPHSENYCPIKLALEEQLPGRAIEVWSDVIVIDDYEVKTPPDVATWIGDYDELKAVGPIAFEIEIPEARA